MTVKSYGDEVTRRELESYESRTITFINQSAYNEIGKIISDIEQSGFVLSNLRMIYLDSQDAATVCATRMELASFFKDSFVIIELLGNDCLNRWSSYCNQKYPIQSVYTSSDQHEANTLIDLLFKKRLGKTSATYDSCTLCLIKPHILKEGKAGEIITSILETGFMVSAIELYRVNRATADEFLEVYKGVIPEFALCVDSLTNGALIALEIRAENPVNTFRTYCGPYDVEIAKQLRPKTLRAIFGHDKVNNAVHCTDLEEDGTLECEFFFQILNSTC